MAIDVGFTAAVDNAEAAFHEANFAMVAVHGAQPVKQRPVTGAAAYAASATVETVTRKITMEQLRRVTDNQAQVHARPRIRTTAGYRCSWRRMKLVQPRCVPPSRRRLNGGTSSSRSVNSRS
ncbi:hypothetical protein D3C85_1038510 [compost metagenome]